MIIPKAEYDISMSDLNLTSDSTYPTNNQWFCTITLQAVSNPEYEEIKCTKSVASENDFSTLAVKY